MNFYQDFIQIVSQFYTDYISKFYQDKNQDKIWKNLDKIWIKFGQVIFKKITLS